MINFKKNYFFILIILNLLLVIIYCDTKNDVVDGNEIIEKDKIEDIQLNDKDKIEDIIINKTTNRFKILKNNENVGEYLLEVDKSNNLWKIEEKTLFNRVLYKKAETTFNPDAKVVIDQNITIYTNEGEDSILISRDNSDHKYEVTYIQGENTAQSLFPDDKDTYIININLFGTTQLMFQTIQPVTDSVELYHIIPGLQNYFEAKITFSYEEDINLNNNIFDCVVLNIERSGEIQKVWLNKKNYKIIMIKVIDEVTGDSIEIKRIIENEEDLYSANEINKLDGYRDYSALNVETPIVDDGNEIEAINYDSIIKEENDIAEDLNEIDTDNMNIEENGELDYISEIENFTETLIQKESKIYEFLSPNGVRLGFNHYIIVDSPTVLQVAEQTNFNYIAGPKIIEKSYKIDYLWSKRRNQMFTYDSNMKLKNDLISTSLIERNEDILMLIDNEYERMEISLLETEQPLIKREMEDLYFINPFAFSQLEMLLRHIDYSKRYPIRKKMLLPETAQKINLEILSSTLMRGGEVDTLFSQLKLDIKIGNRNIIVYLNNNNKTIYKIDFPLENMILRLISEKEPQRPHISNIEIFKNIKVNATNNLKLKESISNFKISNHQSISADILIKNQSPFRLLDISNRPIDYYLDNKLQTFNGVINNNIITGNITTNKIVNTNHNSDTFPIEIISTNLNNYLKSEENKIYSILSDDEDIIKKATEITNDATTIFEATKNIADWVNKNIKYNIEHKNFRDTFLIREGNSGSIAQLTISMLRAVGIPARVVGGLLFDEIYDFQFGQHYWVEVWIGSSDGWVMIDPTIGETNFISPLHISLWRWDSILLSNDNFITIKNIEIIN